MPTTAPLGHLLRMRPRRVRRPRRGRLGGNDEDISIVRVARVSAHALAGLAVLNALVPRARGCAFLWVRARAGDWVRGRAARGTRVPRRASRPSGSLWTLLLIVGVPFSLGVVRCRSDRARRRIRRRRRAAWSAGSAGQARTAGDGLARRRGRDRGSGSAPRGPVPRGAALGPLRWDAWSFWVPKAKAIYFFGELDEQFFTELPGASYPPLVPVLDAAAFHVMGGPDVVTLHAQYWLLGVGFVWALAGLSPSACPPGSSGRSCCCCSSRRASVALPDHRGGPAARLPLRARRGARRLLAPRPRALEARGRDAASVRRWCSRSARVCCSRHAPRRGRSRRRSATGGRLAARSPSAAVSSSQSLRRGASGTSPTVSREGPVGGARSDRERGPPLAVAAAARSRCSSSSDYWSVIVPVVVGALVLAALARAFVPGRLLRCARRARHARRRVDHLGLPELPMTQELGRNPIVRYMGAAALLCVAASPLLLASAWSL